MPTVLRPDPFNAVLFNSPPLTVSLEQQELVKKVLERACADSRFADKAYLAISLILKGNNIRPATVTSLTPNSAELGDPSFTLHVHGANYDTTSKIIFNGFEEPTTFVSATELTTGVDMSVWAAPAVLPVAVVKNGVMSEPMMFTFVDGLSQVGVLSVKKEEVKQQEFKFPDDKKEDK
jgi:hypothetical protein